MAIRQKGVKRRVTVLLAQILLFDGNSSNLHLITTQNLPAPSLQQKNNKHNRW